MEGSKKAVSVIRQTDTDRWCCELLGSYFDIFWQQCKVPAENMALLAELYASCRSPSAADL